MFQLGLLVVGMFLLQAALSGLQMRHFSKEFVQLRRRGKVACGEPLSCSCLTSTASSARDGRCAA